MSEYHKIETLYERDPTTFKLKPELVLKNSVYSCVRNWEWTEKVDGTNIRIQWTPGAVYPPNSSLVLGGKTDAAQIHTELLRWLQERVSVELLRAIFPETSLVIYGECYGAGIQKGGGLYSSTKKFIVFDVFVVDTVNTRLGGWWLSDANMRDVAGKLGLDAVPYVGTYTLQEASDMVRNGLTSKCAEQSRPMEGLVGRPLETLYDKKGHRLIVKLKTKDFA